MIEPVMRATSLGVEVLGTLREADALAPSWRALLRDASCPSLTRGPAWMLTWWRVFGRDEGRALRLFAFRRDGRELVGVVPLLRRTVWLRGVVPVRRLELLASGEREEDEICSDYVGATVRRGEERAVARALVVALVAGANAAWDELVLPTMRGDDPFVPALLDALGEARLEATVTTSGESPYVPLVPSIASWDAYLAALGGERRYLVTRSLRELEAFSASTPPRLVHASTPAMLDEGMRILVALHAERWKADGRPGVFASPRFARFHALLARRLFADEREGGVSLDWLEARGRPIAASYAFVDQGCVQFYQSGRALDVPPKVRPGIALHALLVKRAIASGLREYDFLSGPSQYKRQLALAVRPLITVRVLASGRRSRAVSRARDGLATLDVLARALRQRLAPRTAPGEPPAPARER